MILGLILPGEKASTLWFSGSFPVALCEDRDLSGATYIHR
jgi:hypothetical protein